MMALDQRLQDALSPLMRYFQIRRAIAQREAARLQHGSLAELAEQEFDKALFAGQLGPEEHRRVMAAPNPFLAAVDWLRLRRSEEPRQ